MRKPYKPLSFDEERDWHHRLAMNNDAKAKFYYTDKIDKAIRDTADTLDWIRYAISHPTNDAGEPVSYALPNGGTIEPKHEEKYKKILEGFRDINREIREYQASVISNIDDQQAYAIFSMYYNKPNIADIAVAFGISIEEARDIIVKAEADIDDVCYWNHCESLEDAEYERYVEIVTGKEKIKSREEYFEATRI